MKVFDEIYGLYARRLFAFCLKYTKSKENAEEIMEDTFVWLWNNRSNHGKTKSARIQKRNVFSTDKNEM